MAERASTAALPLRLFVGGVFLHASLRKHADGWLTNTHMLTTTLQGWLDSGKAYTVYAPFLRGVVLPHVAQFSFAVAIGELLTGAALLAGLFTRVAAFGALLLSTSFLLGKGDPIDANSTAPIIAMSLALMMSHSGRVLGLDAALADRVPSWLT